MADLVIRDLDPDLETRLRDRAAEKGRTVEDEAHSLLRGLLAAGTGTREHDGTELGPRIVQRIARIGLKPGEELQRPEGPWNPPRFDAQLDERPSSTRPFCRS